MTADELRISDGSSDVCSSDLRCAQKGGRAHGLSRIFIASARLFAADRRYQGSRQGCRRNGARLWKAGDRPALSRQLTRSEEYRVGKECVRKVWSRLSP